MEDQLQKRKGNNPAFTLFSIVRSEVELVKPSSPTPSDTVLSFSSIDNLAGFETLTPSIFVYAKKPCSSADNYRDDTALVIKEALSKALVAYYPLAGRLKRHRGDGRLRLTCNAHGVPFLVAAVDCSLSSLNYLDGISMETTKQFVFCSPPSDCPLAFQVTKFSCGGFVIGFGMSHSVCDGLGAAQFLKALAELSRGGDEPTVKPVWERHRLLGKPTKDLLQAITANNNTATLPYKPTSDISHQFISINREAVKRLKETLGPSSSGTSFTTIEALGAFVWRARFRALQLNASAKTSFHLAVNIRKLVDPPLPEGYYGNAFLSSRADLPGKELDEEPLFRTAELIKETKRDTFSSDFVTERLDFFEAMIIGGKNVKIPASGTATVLTDWRNLDFTEADIGFAWEAVNVTTLPWDMFGYVDLCFFLPPSKLDPSMKGGVKIMVSLPEPAMAKFKEEIDLLIR